MKLLLQDKGYCSVYSAVIVTILFFVVIIGGFVLIFGKAKCEGSRKKMSNFFYSHCPHSEILGQFFHNLLELFRFCGILH